MWRTWQTLTNCLLLPAATTTYPSLVLKPWNRDELMRRSFRHIQYNTRWKQMNTIQVVDFQPSVACLEVNKAEATHKYQCCGKCSVCKWGPINNAGDITSCPSRFPSLLQAVGFNNRLLGWVLIEKSASWGMKLRTGSPVWCCFPSRMFSGVEGEQGSTWWPTLIRNVRTAES